MFDFYRDPLSCERFLLKSSYGILVFPDSSQLFMWLIRSVCVFLCFVDPWVQNPWNTSVGEILKDVWLLFEQIDFGDDIIFCLLVCLKIY